MYALKERIDFNVKQMLFSGFNGNKSVYQAAFIYTK